MIEVKENTYWNRKGLLQSEYNKQFEELVPAMGKCDSLQGEFLRAAERLYYRWYNDGDQILYCRTRPDSSAENAWGFLYSEAKNNLKAHWKMESIAEDVMTLPQSRTDEEYSECLEKLMDDTIEFAKSRPLIPNELDMCDDRYSDHCIRECDLLEYDEDEEEDDDEYDGVWSEDDYEDDEDEEEEDEE